MFSSTGGISCLETRVEGGAGMEIVFCVSLASQLATRGEGAEVRVEASRVLCPRRYIILDVHCANTECDGQTKPLLSKGA